MQTLPQRIDRARELLRGIPHVALATVNNDGSPHNSPLFIAFDGQLNGYWSSDPASIHSRNINRDGKVFMVLFDSREGHGGLFIEAEAEALEDSKQARHAFALLSARKGRVYGAMGDIEMYVGDGPQRLYRACPLRVWVNQSERDAQGAIIRDERHEVVVAELL